MKEFGIQLPPRQQPDLINLHSCNFRGIGTNHILLELVINYNDM